MKPIFIQSFVAAFLFSKHSSIELTFLTYTPKVAKQIKSINKSNDLYLVLKEKKEKYVVSFRIDDYTVEMNDDDGIIQFSLTIINKEEFSKLAQTFYVSRSVPTRIAFSIVDKWWTRIAEKIERGWVRSTIFAFKGVILDKKDNESLKDIEKLGVGYLTYIN